MEWGDANNCLEDLRSGLESFGCDALPADQRLNYLGVCLRERAPSGFSGMLGGGVEVYRSVERNSAKVFTPVGEHIVAELTEAATPFVLSAFNSERRFSQSLLAFPSQLLGSVSGADQLNKKLKDADRSFRSDLQKLLEGWDIAQASKRSFFAFRTLRDRCKAFWPVKPEPDFDKAEKKARSALQQGILMHDDLLLDEPAVEVDSALLDGFEVKKQHKECLLELGLILVPLVDRRQLSGILGLEFGSDTKALRMAKEVIGDKKDIEAEFVRTSIMRIWIGHRQHLRALFGASFEHLSVQAAKAGKLRSAQDLFNFVAVGSANLLPNERSYGELAATALRRVPSDAKCSLEQECDNWKIFARRLGGQLQVHVKHVELMAVPSAVRMVLAASTAPVLWGGKADISLAAEENSGWRYVSIAPHKNGHESLRKEGLALTKGISEYRGWDCKYTGQTLCIAFPSLLP